MDVVAVVVDRDRLDELPALGLRELREVIELHHAARRPGLAHDGPSDRPLVEGVPAASLDQAERPRQVGVAEDAVHPGWLAVGEERVHGVGVRPQVGRERPPVVSHALVDGEALRGVPARRLQDLPEAHRAEALEDRVPPGDSARDGHRVDPAAGDLVDAQRLVEVLRRPPLRRPPAGLQAVQLLVPSRPHEREHVTAEARGHRLDHTGRGGGGDRRVDGVATVQQDALGRRGHQRLARGGDAVAREHLRARLLGVPLGPAGANRRHVAAGVRDVRGRLAERSE